MASEFGYASVALIFAGIAFLFGLLIPVLQAPAASAPDKVTP
jgi:hypothetical protein